MAEQAGFEALRGKPTKAKVKALEKEIAKKHANTENASDAIKKDKTAMVKFMMEDELSRLFPGEANPVAFWFGDHVTDASFLGKQIRKSDDSLYGGVHRSFLDVLQKVETDLVADLPCNSPKECGKYLNVRDVQGLRGPKSATGGAQPSMHVYGLAIDIDHTENPMFRDEQKADASEKYQKSFNAMNTERKQEGKLERPWTNEVITMANASELMTGNRESLNSIDRSKMTTPEITDKIRWFSKILAEYFALLENDAELAKKVQEYRARGGEKDVDEWRNIIEWDYTVAQANDLMIVPKAPKDSSKNGKNGKNGKNDDDDASPPAPVPPPYVAPLITLKDELIIAMENNKITWGGRHNTPDLMHFDLRSGVFGKRRDQFEPP